MSSSTMSSPILSSVESALHDYARGQMIIIVDDEDRENEGDLVLAADFVTPEAINFMVTHARGLVCLAMRGALLDRLQIPMMVPQAQNRSGFGTGFTLSVEATQGVSTGISAHDRAHTIKTLIHPETTPTDIAMPGHIFPLRARDGGVLERRGQTEASVDVSALAGLTPAGIICEVMQADGSMMRLSSLEQFALEHQLKIISVEQLVQFRLESGQGNMASPLADYAPASNTNAYANDPTDTRVSEQKQESHAASGTESGNDTGAINTAALIVEIGRSHLPTEYGDFEIVIFRDTQGFEHSVLIRGDISIGAPLIRLHSECLTGDTFGSQRCDCGPQLTSSMKLISQRGSGAILYLRQEGRGIGLGNKIRAYALQDKGFDTVDANHELGFPADARTYDVAAAMLLQLGVGKIRILSNNPAKQQALEKLGISVVSREPLVIKAQQHNVEYLKTKATRMGHNYEHDDL